MPSFVIDEKCDGCKGGDKTACMYICPNDLMVLDVDRMKAYNSEPDMCWECYNCVKICPTQAVEVRGDLLAVDLEVEGLALQRLDLDHQQVAAGCSGEVRADPGAR